MVVNSQAADRIGVGVYLVRVRDVYHKIEFPFFYISGYARLLFDMGFEQLRGLYLVVLEVFMSSFGSVYMPPVGQQQPGFFYEFVFLLVRNTYEYVFAFYLLFSSQPGCVERFLQVAAEASHFAHAVAGLPYWGDAFKGCAVAQS